MRDYNRTFALACFVLTHTTLNTEEINEEDGRKTSTPASNQPSGTHCFSCCVFAFCSTRENSALKKRLNN